MTMAGNQDQGSLANMRDKAQHMASRVVDTVQETAGQVTGSGSGSTGPDGGTPLMDQAKDQVSSRLDMGKDFVAEAMTDVAQALRQAGKHLREEGSQPTVAQYADRGAEQVESIGTYLRKHDSAQLVTDVERFARRQPMVFAGGAFALGMLAVRFFRSESLPRQPMSSTPASGAGTYGSATPGASSVPGRTGTTTTPGSTTPPVGTTPGARPAVPNRQPSVASPTAPSPARPSTGAGIGTSPGTGTGGATQPGRVQPGRTTPTPPTASSSNETSADTQTTTRLPQSGGWPGHGARTSERFGAGY
jgi:hypothetical protein